MRKLCKHWVVASIMAIVVSLVMVSAQAGAETIKLRAREVAVTNKVEVLEIGDVPGHFIGIFDRVGLSTNLETGEVGSRTTKGSFDYTKGTGTHDGYTAITYEDGSSTTAKFHGTARKDPEGEGSSFEGEWTFVAGTGRYAGIKGEGTYKGRRLAPMGAAAVIYSDVVGTYTLP